MTESIKLLEVVALTEDLPQKHLSRGQVGTVVETLAEGVYKARFGDELDPEAFDPVEVNRMLRHIR